MIIWWQPLVNILFGLFSSSIALNYSLAIVNLYHLHLLH